jgi:hypothetical protein
MRRMSGLMHSWSKRRRTNITDEHLWAERFDKVARLSRSIGVEMLRNEADRSGFAGGQGDVIDCWGRRLDLPRIRTVPDHAGELKAHAVLPRVLGRFDAAEAGCKVWGAR